MFQRCFFKTQVTSTILFGRFFSRENRFGATVIFRIFLVLSVYDHAVWSRFFFRQLAFVVA